MAIATERVYAPDANGDMRLIAAPGDVIPDAAVAKLYGIHTPKNVVASEPIPEYENLTEAQILGQMQGMTEEERTAVREWEQAHLARGSITRWGLRDTVLRSGKGPVIDVPAESTAIRDGYPGMAEADLDAELARRGLTVRANAGKASKVKALQADDAAKAEKVDS